MEASIVTVKGQVVIPSKMRHKLGIKNGTRVHFYEDHGELRLVPVTHDIIDSNMGMLGSKGRLLKSLMEEKKRERAL